jgi:SAM-dependent methyltransferase
VRRLSQRVIYRAPNERDDCPACGSRALFDLDVLPLRAGRTGFVCGCDDCGLVFSNPLPAAEKLAEFYSPSGEWAAERQDDEEAHGPSAGRVGGTWTQMFEPIRSEVNVAAPPPGARVLDFGCGEGKLLDLMQNCGWQTFGIEPALDRAFRRHQRLLEIPEAPTFDVIVTIQVLEHVPNPLHLLRQLAGACRVGGHLLVGVPRFDTLPKHRDYRYVLNGRAHITAYTWACLRTLLARAGWEPVGLPPLEIGKGGGGRRTTSRLRVLARRVDRPVNGADAPGEDARAAVRGYYAGGDSRPLTARMGLLRLAARTADMNRRRAKADRKAAARQDTISGSRVV